VTRRLAPIAFALCAVPFVVLATLNSGGYRYGASDQAFYQPAVLLQLDPGLFPRDARVLAAQTTLTAADEVIALVVRGAGMTIPRLFAALYAGSLILFAWGVWQIAGDLYRTRGAAVALLAAMTLRHAIARSGTNTLEGYFHPRLVAYAIGAVAIASFLRGRSSAAALLVLIAAFIHPTTALWLAVWLGAAAAVAEPGRRRWIIAAASLGAAAALWALTAGPLAARLSTMDAQWRGTLATKDYLFPLDWPVYAWVFNLGYLPVIIWIYRRRASAGLVSPRERGLVLGSFSLAAIFAAALVLHAVGVTLAFQLQPARVFWVFDFLATIYVVWGVAEGSGASTRRAQVAALAITACSLARGIHVIVEAERPPVQITVPDDDWGRVMAWVRTTGKDSGFLADPLHAVRYGTSLRVAGERDVFVEAVKDAALGMYDRRIAVRTDERIRAIPDYDRLAAPEARRLGGQYDLDFMITEQQLDLPLVFESGRLRVYRLQ
jgi:hypothetical protein